MKLKSGLASVDKLCSVLSILICNALRLLFRQIFEPHGTIYVCPTVKCKMIGPTVISGTGKCSLGTTVCFGFSTRSSSSLAFVFCWAEMLCSSFGFWKTV